MKFTHLLILLLAFGISYSQSAIPQIDSIVANYSPVVRTMPAQDVGLDIYVNDTLGIASVHIKLGTHEGATDMFEGDFAGGQLHLLADSVTGQFYIKVDAGVYSLTPPFVEAYLSTQNGEASEVSKVQLVY